MTNTEETNADTFIQFLIGEGTVCVRVYVYSDVELKLLIITSLGSNLLFPKNVKNSM